VDAAVEASNCPDWRQPCEHECPSFRPQSQIFHIRENEVSIVPLRRTTDGKGDDSRENKDEVHKDKHCL